MPKIQILVKFQNINSHHESHSYVIGFEWIGQDNRRSLSSTGLWEALD